MFEIEKGVPMPHGGRALKYPIADMKVGDSFVIPHLSVNSACRMATSPGWRKFGRFSVRTLPEGGVRVWRIE